MAAGVVPIVNVQTVQVATAWGVPQAGGLVPGLPFGQVVRELGVAQEMEQGLGAGAPLAA